MPVACPFETNPQPFNNFHSRHGRVTPHRMAHPFLSLIVPLPYFVIGGGLNGQALLQYLVTRPRGNGTYLPRPPNTEGSRMSPKQSYDYSPSPNQGCAPPLRHRMHELRSQSPAGLCLIAHYLLRDQRRSTAENSNATLFLHCFLVNVPLNTS